MLGNLTDSQIRILLYIMIAAGPLLLALSFFMKKNKALNYVILISLSMIVCYIIININIEIGSDDFFGMNQDKTYLPSLSMISLMMALFSLANYFNRNHKEEKMRVRYTGDGRD